MKRKQTAWWAVIFSFLAILALIGLISSAYADPPDFIPPGHQYGGQGGDSSSSSTSNATGIGVGVGVGIGVGIGKGGEGGAGGAGGTGGNASAVSGGSESSANIEINSSPIKDGAFRQHPDPIQPPIPGFITQDPKTSGTVYLNDLKRLPPKINMYTILRTKGPKCSVRIIPRDGSPDSPRFHPDYVKLYSVDDEKLIHIKYVLGLPVKEEGKRFDIIGDVVGTCEGGSHFDLDLRIREKAMAAGGNGIVYFQSGKKEDVSAWSAGLGLGGVRAELGGDGLSKAISLGGVLGFSYGTASVDEIPGLMGHVLLVHEGTW